MLLVTMPSISALRAHVEFSAAAATNSTPPRLDLGFAARRAFILPVPLAPAPSVVLATNPGSRVTHPLSCWPPDSVVVRD